MDEENKHRCYNCINFDCFYTKEVKRFKRAECGWCFFKAEIINKFGTCGNYKSKPRKRPVKRALMYYLSDLLTQISEIRVIIAAEINGESEDL